jgi:hypothetical protein
MRAIEAQLTTTSETQHMCTIEVQQMSASEAQQMKCGQKKRQSAGVSQPHHATTQSLKRHSPENTLPAQKLPPAPLIPPQTPGLWESLCSYPAAGKV